TFSTNKIDTGLTTISKYSSSKSLRSDISPWIVLNLSPSRLATISSCSNCFFDMSVIVTSAPAAAKIGPCWPPPDAKQSIFNPDIDLGNQFLGTDFSVVTPISHTPDLLFSIISLLTDWVYLEPSSTFLFQALLLCFIKSIVFILLLNKLLFYVKDLFDNHK